MEEWPVTSATGESGSAHRAGPRPAWRANLSGLPRHVAKPITARVSAETPPVLSAQQRVADAAQREVAEGAGAASPPGEALRDQDRRLAALVRLEVQRVEALAVDHGLAFVADHHAVHATTETGDGSAG